MHKKTRVIFLILTFISLALLCLSMMPLQRIQSSRHGIIIIENKSWFGDILSHNGRVIYKCNLTLKNDTKEEKHFSIYAIQIIEYIFGSITDPIMLAFDDTSGSQIMTLAPNEERMFSISFVSRRGYGPLFKTNRNIPFVVLKTL